MRTVTWSCGTASPAVAAAVVVVFSVTSALHTPTGHDACGGRRCRLLTATYSHTATASDTARGSHPNRAAAPRTARPRTPFIPPESAGVRPAGRLARPGDPAAGYRPGQSGLLGLPEDRADLLDLGQQLVGLGRVRAALGARRARGLGGLVEQLVELRVLLEVRRLEVVGPQHPQVVLDQLGALFLYDQATGPELRVRVRLVLLVDA